MSRLFDGVDDQMVYTIPAAGGPNFTFGTMLVLVKIATTTDNAWLSFIEGETSGAGLRFAIGRQNSSPGRLYYANGTVAPETASVTIEDSEGWAIMCATKATGSVAPTHHKIIVSTGTRTTAAPGVAAANSTTTANGNLRLGGNDDFANIYLGAAAIWVGTVLSTAQLDGIASAKTTQSILDLSPTWCVDDSDGLATDLTAGTVDRATLVGTTDSADDPAGWVYFGGGAAVDIPYLAMAPPVPA